MSQFLWENNRYLVSVEVFCHSECIGKIDPQAFQLNPKEVRDIIAAVLSVGAKALDDQCNYEVVS